MGSERIIKGTPRAPLLSDVIIERDSLARRVEEMERECERLRKTNDDYRHAVTEQLHYDMKAIVSDTPENRAKQERNSLRADNARLVAENERMRAVYEVAARIVQLRERQRRLGDLDYDQLDGQIGDELDALDAALAAEASQS